MDQSDKKDSDVYSVFTISREILLVSRYISPIRKKDKEEKRYFDTFIQPREMEL